MPQPDTQAAEPSELVQSLLDPAPSELFQFVRVKPDESRVEIPVRVRLLRIDENIAAISDAQKDAKAKGEVAKEYGDIYKESQAVQLLTRALCRLEKRTRDDGTEWYPPQFVEPKQLRASFTEPELAQCLNMYEIVKAKYGAIEELSEEELDLWVERLAGPLGMTWLARLDSSRWPVLLLLMAKRFAPFLPPTPSDSQPSSESDPESSGLGTGFSSVPPAEHVASGEQLPTDHMMTADEARARVQGILRPNVERPPAEP